MPTPLPTQRGLKPMASTPICEVEATLRLSAWTVAWLAPRPLAQALVDSVWDTLPELERALVPCQAHLRANDGCSDWIFDHDDPALRA